MTDTIKIIESQQVFAKNVYLDFMSKRFGITPCCITDPIGSNIKKQLCDWKALDRDIPEIQAIASEIFYPSSFITPCEDPLAPDWCKDCGYFEPENSKILLEQIAKLEAQLAELCAEKADIEKKIEDLENDIENVTAKIAKITTVIADLKILLDSQQTELFELEVQSKIVCQDPDSDACQQIILQIKALMESIQNIQDEIQAYEDELLQLGEQLASMQNTLAELQAQLANIQSQIDTTLAEIQAIEALFCDDSECITISVTDQHGDPVENYEIILDGGNAGFTDYHGMFYYTVSNASINTDHTLQICYCFDTEGICRQQKISITVNTGKDKEDCTPSKNCDDIKITKTIIGTPPVACAAVPSNDNRA